MKIKKLKLLAFTGVITPLGLMASSYLNSATSAEKQPSPFANLYKGEDSSFWKSYQNIDGTSKKINTIYQDYSKMKSMGEDPDNANIGGAEFGGYAGIAGGDDSPYDFSEIAKNSTAQNITFAFKIHDEK